MSDYFCIVLLLLGPGLWLVQCYIVNLCLTTGDFLISCKSSIVIPFIRKPGLNREMLKNYRPVSNLFYPKLLRRLFLFVFWDIF